jgi:drug/metabolite transporter (DMT)-like permease
MLLGLLGVVAFSLTLPATRAAVEFLHPLFISSGRVVVAAVLAGIYLMLGRHRRPTSGELRSLAAVALCVAAAFPILTAVAMQYVDASHGGVMLGVLPLSTAAAGFAFAHERPSLRFWLFALCGSTAVVAFSLLKGGGTPQMADLALIGAVLSTSIGYAIGARLTRTLGGLQVISWALVLIAPVMIVPAIINAPDFSAVPARALVAFAYVAAVSQFLGFLPWYKGLALGGVAKVGQTQLLQPFFTFAAASVFLGEKIDLMTMAFALLVVAIVAAGRGAAVARRI